MRRSQVAFIGIVALLIAGRAFAEVPVSPAAFAPGTHQYQPVVATDGTRFLVAWTDVRSGTNEVRVSLAATDGSMLTPEGTLISGTNTGSAVVAWDGNDYVVVWVENDGVHYARIKSDGTPDFGRGLVFPRYHQNPVITRSDYGVLVLGTSYFGETELALIDTRGMVHAPVRISAGSSPVAGCGAAGCLVAWGTYDDMQRPEIVGRRVSPDGRLLDQGEPMVLVQDAFDPRLTSNGERLLLTWRDPAPAYSFLFPPYPLPIKSASESVTSRRSIRGRFLDGAPFTIVSDPARDVTGYTVTAGSTGFVVGWSAYADVDIIDKGVEHLDEEAGSDLAPRSHTVNRVVEAARVTSTGAVGKVFPLIQSRLSSVFSMFSIATTGRDLFACWTEDAASAGWRIAGGLAYGDNPAFPTLRVGGPATQVSPSLAYGAGQYAVVWLEDKLGDGRQAAFVRRFTAGLTPIDEKPVVVSGEGDASIPLVAFDGKAFVVFWNEGGAHARWLGLDGSLSAPLNMSTASYDQGAIVAHDGQAALLSHLTPGDRVAFTLLQPDRTFHSIDLGAGGRGGVSLAWDGIRYLAIESNATAVKLIDAGAGAAESIVFGQADGALSQSPAVACNRDECIIAWWRLNGGVNATRLRGSQFLEIGTLLEDFNDFTPPSKDRFYPEVVAMAGDFLLTSVDAGGFLWSRSIAHGVLGKERLLFPPAEPVRSSASAAGDPTNLVIAYQRAAHEGPFAGAQRIFLRSLDTNP